MLSYAHSVLDGHMITIHIKHKMIYSRSIFSICLNITESLTNKIDIDRCIVTLLLVYCDGAEVRCEPVLDRSQV